MRLTLFSTQAWRLQQVRPQVRPVDRRRVDGHVHGRLADREARLRRLRYQSEVRDVAAAAAATLDLNLSTY